MAALQVAAMAVAESPVTCTEGMYLVPFHRVLLYTGFEALNVLKMSTSHSN
jgi:hypothetical protein